jgi:hypothetical protein
MELLLAAAFHKTLGGCCGPDVLLFKRFREQWATIDKTNFQAGSSDEYVEDKVCLVRQDVLSFAYAHLQIQQVRDDYREFLELSVIFLGGVPIRGTRFLAPGGIHHARWLSKALYAIKMWMFRSQLKLTEREVTGLRDLAVFCVRIYLKAWFTAPLVLHAPYNDFQLMNSLDQYSSVHPEISAATIKKLLLHLWYLSEELVPLAFFDDRVSSSTKQLMVTALRSPSRHSARKRFTTDFSAFSQPDKLLEQFVTSKSTTFFERLNLPTTFLSKDPAIWEQDDDFTRARDTAKSLQVVNDCAERGLALIKELNKKLTKDEGQLQFLLQVVADHRQLFPMPNKKTLVEQGHQ